MKYVLGQLFETTIKTENRWFDPLVLELLAQGEIICPKQVSAFDTIGMQPYKFVSCHPTFTDIFWSTQNRPKLVKIQEVF